jgi:type VI secretion system protein ImpE
MEAAIRWREGALAEAAEILTRADAERPHSTGTVDGNPFDDFRDTDDLTLSVLEVITSGGKYFWVPFSRIESIEFEKPERPRDLIWRRAHLIVSDGPDGEVFIPAIYAGSTAEPDDSFKLGRVTEWKGNEGTPIRGIGQRVFQVGREDIPIMDLGLVTFNRPAVAPDAEPLHPHPEV